MEGPVFFGHVVAERHFFGLNVAQPNLQSMPGSLYVHIHFVHGFFLSQILSQLSIYCSGSHIEARLRLPVDLYSTLRPCMSGKVQRPSHLCLYAF